MAEYWAPIEDHIDELRVTIVKSLLMIGIGFICLLGFYQPIIQFITQSSSELLHPNLEKQTLKRQLIVNETNTQQIIAIPKNSIPISYITHPNQENGLSYHLLSPHEAFAYEETLGSPLLILGPIEGIMLVCKACFWLSIALTAPGWGWFWLQFILPGLKETERSLILPFFICSLVSLFFGISFAHYVTLPMANQSLLIFNSSIGQNAWTLSNYVNYVLLLFTGHAIAAELSLFLLVLVHFRVLSATQLISMRRYMIVAAFILGAILTPPDIFSQILLALPLVVIFELSVCYARWRSRVKLETGS